jgi:predicted transcriptional regulator of viral defense system
MERQHHSAARRRSNKRLARWREQGWLSRVGSGAYVPASIDTLGSDQVLDDAWILVPAIFAPAYIGGRTAAEHWDLTEQIFQRHCGDHRTNHPRKTPETARI